MSSGDAASWRAGIVARSTPFVTSRMARRGRWSVAAPDFAAPAVRCRGLPSRCARAPHRSAWRRPRAASRRIVPPSFSGRDGPVERTPCRPGWRGVQRDLRGDDGLELAQHRIVRRDVFDFAGEYEGSLVVVGGDQRLQSVAARPRAPNAPGRAAAASTRAAPPFRPVRPPPRVPSPRAGGASAARTARRLFRRRTAQDKPRQNSLRPEIVCLDLGRSACVTTSRSAPCRRGRSQPPATRSGRDARPSRVRATTRLTSRCRCETSMASPPAIRGSRIRRQGDAIRTRQ